uniref:Cytochrome b6-f complex subunit PetP n=1 Tax=Cyanidiaceae sp. MX-AZ01 TaxID=1503164 RepID=A0A060A8T0_9RHOD|nr:hypothetical protein [Cyanidiaceae sp. MX-AZ01]
MKKFVAKVPIEILRYVGTIVTIKGYKLNQYIVETKNGYRFWVFPQEIETVSAMVSSNDGRTQLAKNQAS